MNKQQLKEILERLDQIETTTQCENPFNLILKRLEDIERKIEALNQTSAPKPDRWLNVDDFINYHPGHPKRSTVYVWTCKKQVPFHKRGGSLCFLESEISEWLKAGRKTISQN